MKKRIVSVLLVCMLVLTSMVAFASPKTEFEALVEQSQTVTKADVIADIAIRFDQPLSDVLDPEGMVQDMLEGSLMTINAKMDASEDYRSVKMEMSMEMPIIARIAAMIGEKAPIDAGSVKAWIDLDFSADPVRYMVIMESPELPGMYLYSDYAAMPEFEGMMDQLEQMFDMETMTALNEEFYGNIQLPDEAFSYENGTYKVRLTAEQLYDAVGVLFDAMSVYMTTTMGAALEVEGITAEEFTNEIKTTVSEIAELLDGVQIFDDPALELEYTVDGKKQLTGESYSINIKTSLAALAQRFGATDIGIAEEDATLDASLVMNGTINPLADEIVLPELTEENSFDMLGDAASIGIIGGADGPTAIYVAEPDPNRISVVFDGVAAEFTDAVPFVQDGRTLIPVRAVSNLFGIADEDITYDNGVVTIYAFGDVITLTVGENEVKVVRALEGEKVVTLDVPALEKGDRVYVPVRFISETLGYHVDWKQFNDENGVMTGGVVEISYY